MKSRKLLPRLSRAVHETFAETIDRNYSSDVEFISRNLKNIQKKNPNLFHMITNWTSDLKGNRFVHTIMGMLIIYKLLENQAEVDELEGKRG
jgi:hypothetical protein